MDALTSEPHAAESGDVVRQLRVDPDRGLDAEEVRRRRLAVGPNSVTLDRQRGPLAILGAQMSGLIVWLLAGAALLSALVGDRAEAIAIAVVLVLNGAIGFFTELSAVRSIDALSRVGGLRGRVRREGEERVVDAADLVPGDILLLEAGDVVSADARLIEASALHADQSILTGESFPARKGAEKDLPSALLADRKCVVFRGTSITQGRALAVVTATGAATELGRIADLVRTSGPKASPLEKRLSSLGGRLVWLSLALIALIAGVGILRGLDPVEMAETAIALAVAAVPEGLPVVATLCLARGMWRIMRRNALVTRLSSVETLGATTLILTDKTGTLTENRMSVIRYLLPGGEVDATNASGRQAAALDERRRGQGAALLEALRIGVLCNHASLDREGAALAGDPMELALLRAGREAGLERPDLLSDLPLQRDYPFDPAVNMMASVHGSGAERLVAVKGAPEQVIPRCTSLFGGGALDASDRDMWLDRAQEAASLGHRILALARGDGGGGASPFDALTLVGLVCIADPLRADVRSAIKACRDAGIRVVMMTGDHPSTAAAIAREAGLVSGEARIVTGADIGDPSRLAREKRDALLAVDVFARISPEQKQALAALFQEAGEIVAMTGDGVNDAPSLRQADIGIAMGQRGTDVARQAAQVVLMDDRFPTIVAAIREGRIIFDNIRRFVVYLMSCNFSEVLLVGAAVLAGFPPPLLPLQILFLNLVTDVFPAFAVGLGRGDGRVMERPPRPPSEPIVTRGGWLRIAVIGCLISSASLASYVLALHDPALSEGQAVTVAFLTLALAQLWNVFNMRAPGSGVLVNDVTRNPFLWWAIALCLALISAAVWLAPLSTVMGLPPPGARGLVLALAASAVPLLLWQAWLLSRRWVIAPARGRRGDM